MSDLLIFYHGSLANMEVLLRKCCVCYKTKLKPLHIHKRGQHGGRKTFAGPEYYHHFRIMFNKNIINFF